MHMALSLARASRRRSPRSKQLGRDGPETVEDPITSKGPGMKRSLQARVSQLPERRRITSKMLAARGVPANTFTATIRELEREPRRPRREPDRRDTIVPTAMNSQVSRPSPRRKDPRRIPLATTKALGSWRSITPASASGRFYAASRDVAAPLPGRRHSELASWLVNRYFRERFIRRPSVETPPRRERLSRSSGTRIWCWKWEPQPRRHYAAPDRARPRIVLN